MRVRELAAVLGLRLVPAKVRGCGREAAGERGWAAERAPGLFTVADDQRGQRPERRLRASRRLMSMVIDHRITASLVAGGVS